MTASCTTADCPGSVLADGYCDTCGAKGEAAPPAPAPASPVSPSTDVPAGTTCGVDGCGGTVLADGYCDTCGTRATGTAGAAGAPPSSGGGTVGASTVQSGTFRSGSATGSRRTSRTSTRSTSRRSQIGEGLVRVASVPEIDPATVIMEKAEVAERKRFCSNCGDKVGRGRAGEPGRLQGFCSQCRTRFDFVPKLAEGDLVGGQYEVAGALAHGGLGWIYLARDTAVSGRWVVLKGLLNSGDDAAMAAAVAERRFLAEVQHPNIVEIYNFATHDGAGYTVMEYVGGKSLKQVLKARLEANGDVADPLPVAEALAYMLAVAPAFTYLHGRGLIYCDFKPDNVIQVGDAVKLIDLGGVRRVDDTQGDIYGTIGFQAPEIAEMGPSVPSDVHTIGRTLAVLTMDFRGYTNEYVASLPPAHEHPALAAHDAFHRLLQKATAPHPDDRFQTVDELAEQMMGVLRIVVATSTGVPQPGPSAVFTGAPVARDLPGLAVDAEDPAAPFLTNLPDDSEAALEAIDDGIAANQVPDTPALRLRRAGELVDLGRLDDALTAIEALLAEDPWAWRAVWLRGRVHLAAGRLDEAAADIDRCRSEAPGELAPIMAAGLVDERAGNQGGAEAAFDLVSHVDRAWIGAAAGLARVRLRSQDVDGALEAHARVPDNHREHAAASFAAIRALLGADRLVEASQRAEALQLGERRALELDVELLQRALDGIVGRSRQEDRQTKIAGVPLAQRELRLGLADRYRQLARITPDDDARVQLVDQANAVRPMTVV